MGTEGEKNKKKILEYCQRYIDEHGYSPSVREIAKGVGLCSTSTLAFYMNQLYDEGALESEHRGSPRAFRLAKVKSSPVKTTAQDSIKRSK